MPHVLWRADSTPCPTFHPCTENYYCAIKNIHFLKLIDGYTFSLQLLIFCLAWVFKSVVFHKREPLKLQFPELIHPRLIESGMLEVEFGNLIFTRYYKPPIPVPNQVILMPYA